ncbi:MAG: hypothetical protein JWN04_1204 [Myxococcaceae bacterium]|nr:hypothetical protein [Myxococcaceae bacterium]
MNTLLPQGDADTAAADYLATLAPSSEVVARSRLQTVARMLLGLAPQPRPKRIGGRMLRLDLSRLPWSSVAVDDATELREAALAGPRARAAAAELLNAFRGVLRHSAMDRGVLWQVEQALRIDGQRSTQGRSVAQVVTEWRADESQALIEWEWSRPIAAEDPRRGPDGRWRPRDPFKMPTAEELTELAAHDKAHGLGELVDSAGIEPAS